MGDVTLRWIITILFGASISAYVYILVAQRGRWTGTVNHLLHLVMSAAMILMAWGVGMRLPTVGPIVFFLLAAVWFAGAARRTSTAAGDRLTNGYYALMMAAMAWMFAAMNGRPSSQFGHSSDHAQSAAPAIDLPGVDMPAHEMSPTEPAAGWITAVNWMATLGFAVVALYWACSYRAGHRTTAGPHAAAQLARLEPVYQACTAAGAAVMFGALL